MKQAELMQAIEPILDRSEEGAQGFIFALARVCNEKAEHIEINWQDKSHAKLWNALAAKLDKIADKTTI